MTEVLANDADYERNTKTSLLRGWRRKCPACGEGAMMNGYLEVSHDCKSCGQELYHHRADDRSESVLSDRLAGVHAEWAIMKACGNLTM